MLKPAHLHVGFGLFFHQPLINVSAALFTLSRWCAFTFEVVQNRVSPIVVLAQAVIMPAQVARRAGRAQQPPFSPREWQALGMGPLGQAPLCPILTVGHRATTRRQVRDGGWQ